MASFASRPVGMEGGLFNAVHTPTCCLLPKGPARPSVLQALQIATSSVARAVWCGSGVMVDGKTEWSSAEVADSLVWIAARG